MGSLTLQFQNVWAQQRSTVWYSCMLAGTRALTNVTREIDNLESRLRWTDRSTESAIIIIEWSLITLDTFCKLFDCAKSAINSIAGIDASNLWRVCKLWFYCLNKCDKGKQNHRHWMQLTRSTLNEMIVHALKIAMIALLPPLISSAECTHS